MRQSARKKTKAACVGKVLFRRVIILVRAYWPQKPPSEPNAEPAGSGQVVQPATTAIENQLLLPRANYRIVLTRVEGHKAGRVIQRVRRAQVDDVADLVYLRLKPTSLVYKCHLVDQS